MLSGLDKMLEPALFLDWVWVLIFDFIRLIVI